MSDKGRIGIYISDTWPFAEQWSFSPRRLFVVANRTQNVRCVRWTERACLDCHGIHQGVPSENQSTIQACYVAIWKLLGPFDMCSAFSLSKVRILPFWGRFSYLISRMFLISCQVSQPALKSRKSEAITGERLIKSTTGNNNVPTNYLQPGIWGNMRRCGGVEGRVAEKCVECSCEPEEKQ